MSLVKHPQPLYDICISVAVSDCGTICSSICRLCKKEFRSLPNNVLFDFYYKMLLEKKLLFLSVEFGNVKVFIRMISVKNKRVKLLECFQTLMDQGSNVALELVTDYEKFTANTEDLQGAIDIGLRIGGFFNEGGWYNHSIRILNHTEKIAKKQKHNVYILKRLLDCYYKRIYAEATYCEFKAADTTFKSAKDVVKELKKLKSCPNLAGLYSNYSLLYFIKSEYDEAFKWTTKALKLLNEDLPSRVIIEVLRQASKSCVGKRKFIQAGLLIRQAVNLDSKIYQNDNHPRFSDTLLDYGFYLLNFDSIEESVKVYSKALTIRKEVFDKNNVQVAVAHEDMAYALYVNEYSSGRFSAARENAEKSLKIMRRILPKEHLLLASIKRVKALILEEMALDESQNPKLQSAYLKEAEQLHQSALALSYKAFGEKNVQTAKHYGNLGRLYQSMKLYEEAEKMHLRAIAIKEELLGKEDYEVGLSIGHLASLYNYHMERQEDAEKLYMRSIEINLALFGEAYSGLEYDYRGLINVYSTLLDVTNMNTYMQKMREWKLVRDQIKPVVHKEELVPIKKIVDKFFSMC